MRFIAILFKLITKIIARDTIFAIVNLFLMLFLPKPSKHYKPGPVSVVGMLRSSSGLGNASRLTLNALEELNLNITTFDVSKLFTSKLLDINIPSAMQENEGGYVIIHANPIHLLVILFLLGRKRLRGKKIIGYFLWETTKLPNNWVKPCKFVHEIWCPSEFVADAYRASVKHIPIYTVPHPLRKPEVVAKPRVNSDTSILIIADLANGYERKNLINSIKVFLEVAAKESDVSLTLKISGAANYPNNYKSMIGLIDSHPNIKIIHNFLTDQEMQELIQSADIVMSLHRSEGFGLIMSQAMWLKKAILATGWSGNLTFLPADCACYVDYKLVDIVDPTGLYSGLGVWAEPDMKDAVVKLLRLVRDEDLRDSLGNKAYAYASNFFTKENFAKAISSSINID